MWVLFTMDPKSESPFCQHALSITFKHILTSNSLPTPPPPKKNQCFFQPRPQGFSLKKWVGRGCVSFSGSMLFQKILGMLSHTEDDIRKSFLNCLRYFWLRTQ